MIGAIWLHCVHEHSTTGHDYSGHNEVHRKLSLYMEAAQMRAALPIQSFSTGIHARAGSWFSRMANATAAWTGKPVAFLLAFATIVIWAVTGPIFHYSDTWQLVINTGTTIITFLMVFLIQNMQNRDAKAIHLKLDELIRAMKGARNNLVMLENLSEDELEMLERQFKRIAKKHRTDSEVEALAHTKSP